MINSVRTDTKSNSRTGVKSITQSKTFFASKNPKDMKHRRIDSGGKQASEKIFDELSKRKRTNSEKDDLLKKSPNSRNRLGEKDSKLSTSSSKAKQVSYSNFSQHFNFPETGKIVSPPKKSSIM